MESKEVKMNTNEIMIKLAKLQSDVDYIKNKLSLDEEIEMWENVSANDSADFFEKNAL